LSSVLAPVLPQQKIGTQPKLVFTPNAEQLTAAYEDPSFLLDLSQADILLPDGVGPLLVSYWLDRQHPIAQRLAGADAVVDVLQLAAELKLPVMVIGGRDYGVVNQFGYVRVHVPLNPQKTLTVTWLPGYVDIAHPTPTEHATVRSVINQIKPAVVLVAFGAPWQEAWSIRQSELLASVNTRLVMVVGGAMDFLLHKVPRAPLFMQKIGLEWLFRLVRQPWRWWRQLKLVKFVWLLCTGIFKQQKVSDADVLTKSHWRID
jgi:N-acetylglucosaminyldiphosphoundecaprenol N-acetyl-beta-D-mannosaminyltransferase